MSCYPKGAEYTSDYNLIGTSFDPAFDFNVASTFVLPDTIVFIQDENDTREYLTDEQEQIILDDIRSNFEAMGWVDSTSTADSSSIVDVVITITGIATKTQGAWWSYWGWYGGWGSYYPGWGGGYYPGWGYPGGGYPVYYEYTTGSLIIEMIDWKNADPEAEGPVRVWGAGLNGFVNRVPVNTNKILEAVDKMFELSPYLDKN